MKFTWKSFLPRMAMKHPYMVFAIVILMTAFMLSRFPSININTDPEDMLPEDHPVRIQDREIENEFFLHDMVAVAIEPPESDYSITPERLAGLYDLVGMVEKQPGVVYEDILSVYTSDDIEGLNGSINVDRFLRRPPEDDETVERLLQRVEKHPVLGGMVLDRASGGIALFIPIEEKKYSYPLRQTILEFWENQPEEQGSIHITGLPVAEETFGHQMFRQMAMSAPLAFLVIGLLMLLFFRSFSLVFWALLQAIITVIWTMGSLIGLGFSIHIMSSMISIFLLPIAVVDSIHILSDFTDRKSPDRKNSDVMAEVYEDIFFPILFTSLTSAAGFYSLTMTGIPPVMVFGAAVGSGILLAFLTTMTILPAGAALWEPKPAGKGEESWIARQVSCCFDCSCIARDYPYIVLAVLAVVMALGVYGMTMIEVNDNPTRWFLGGHPIRVADRYINESFAGSYPAYMVLEKNPGAWHDPAQLEELNRVTGALEALDDVGKVTALSDIMNKIHVELHGGAAESYLPSSAAAISQYRFLYENSGNPEDLFRLVRDDGSKINVWFNLKSGDNRVMSNVREQAENIVAASGLELSKEPVWGGVTVVNLAWQNVMVRGMAWALFSSYVVIFLMMLFLFRSLRWSLLSLLPLTFTLVVVYGLVGWIGKDYDMPVAVLSALSIGVAVDFAIHFIQRSRQLIPNTESWNEARERISGEPARAIARNGIVIAVGFSPLLFAPLRPYVTVGVFMIVIMALSGIATLIGLFAFFEAFHPFLMRKTFFERLTEYFKNKGKVIEQ